MPGNQGTDYGHEESRPREEARRQVPEGEADDQEGDQVAQGQSRREEVIANIRDDSSATGRIYANRLSRGDSACSRFWFDVTD